jgi:LPXTG-site transpeptidase (sortase) family protein
MHTVNVHGLDAFDGPEPQPIAVRTVVSAPQRITSMQGGGSVTTSTQSISLPQYASEKHFAISMPSLGVIDLAVNHPSDPFSNKGVLAPLEYGVGHLFSYPGGGGKIMIYGHSSGYPWDISDYTKIFRRVNELSEGDKIYVTYDGELHIYEVAREQTIDASDTRPFNDNGAGEELILYTCWPPDSIAQRYLIHAYPVKTMALR